MALEYLLLEAVSLGIASEFGNPHAGNYENGCRLLKRITEVELDDRMDIYEIQDFAKHNEYLKSAISAFKDINEDDKLYLRVAAKFNLAVCYCFRLNFDQARKFIS